MGIIDNIHGIKISNRSKILGEEIAKVILDVINNGEFCDKEELLSAEEMKEAAADATEDEKEETTSSSPSKHSNETEDSDDEECKDSIPFEVKVNSVRPFFYVYW